MPAAQSSRKPTISSISSSKSSINVVHQNVMNVSVTARDSLYYVCFNIKKRLEALPQMKPYLNIAYVSSELLSERQSLLLSQKQQQHMLEKQQYQNSMGVPRRMSQGNRSSAEISLGASTTSKIRLSSASNGSLKDDYTMDGITYTSSAGSVNVNSGGSMEDTLLTFSMGILPISMDCDPVTQLSQLFQQGSPLCVLFNAVKPQYKLPVVSSDDLKVCKKSIYDFILGCKQHFAFKDEELFTISDVFTNSTNQVMKILDVVTVLMDSAPEIFPSTEKIQQRIDKEIKASTDSNKRHSKRYEEYNKIIQEFLATERKYVHDLEILEIYKQQLLDRNLITSEELYMLFPNLTDSIDFQRRFLVSLEMNALVDPQKQRIGALFMHSKYFFKLYEPWSIGQNAAIDFLSSTLEKMGNTDFVISNKLELQSFLYKPVQRLCRYPLLLKELLSCYTSNYDVESGDNNSKELEVALDISRKIARNINENQRRTENHQVVKKLYGRVVNWKGYRISKFGELLYYDKVSISTSNSSEPEREFDVYLFEKIIILFSEVQAKKSSSSLMLKKKSASSGTSLVHNSVGAGPSHGHGSGASLSKAAAVPEPKLDLRGRIMIMNLNEITPLHTRSLNITWESIKEQGNFLLKFKNEETRDNWCSCLRSLVRKVKSESYKSTISENSFVSSVSSTPTANKGYGNDSGNSHDSVTSYGSYNTKHISDMLPKQKSRSSNLENEVVLENFRNSIPESCILIRISFNEDFFTLLVELDSTVTQVIDAIKKKLNPLGVVSKIKYQDEDGELLLLESEEDWVVARDMLKENNEHILTVEAYTQ